MPTSVIKQLGLKKVKDRHVRVATGTSTVSIYDVVQFTIMGRDGKLEVIELPERQSRAHRAPPAGNRLLDVDPKNQRLIGDPFTGGEQDAHLF